jgi:hypothetical protein
MHTGSGALTAHPPSPACRLILSIGACFLKYIIAPAGNQPRGSRFHTACSRRGHPPPRRQGIARGWSSSDSRCFFAHDDSDRAGKYRARVPRCARNDSIFGAAASNRRTPAITKISSSRARRGTFTTTATATCDSLGLEGGGSRSRASCPNRSYGQELVASLVARRPIGLNAL